MAINFSASFAACLAAGLKVPRQFMYCIAQEPSAPYVFYGNKENNGDMGSWAGGPESGHFLGGHLQAPQNHTSPQQNISGPQQNHTGPPQNTGPQNQQTQVNGHQNGTATSPPHSVPQNVAQNVPQTVPQNGPQSNGPQNGPQNGPRTPVPQPQPDVQSPANSPYDHRSQNGVGGVEEDGSVELGSGATTQMTQPNSDGDALAALQQVAPASTPSRCFDGSSNQAQYYTRPPHVLSPTSFMNYLKQPTVMITSINPHDPNSDLHPGMQELLTGSSTVKSCKSSSTSDLRLFKCLTCGKDFKQKSTLLQHERIHTDTRPYTCTECGKRFRQQSHLTQHLRIHANEKPFACVYCDRTFRQRAILNQHLRIHSDVSPHLLYKNGQLWPQDVPFPGDTKEQNGFPSEATQEGCFSPEQVTQFPAYFKDSKGVTHGIFSNEGKMLPDLIQHGKSAGMPLFVRCPICQKEFKQKSTLLQHGCVHIESRPYPCGECGKRFRQQSHLTQHLRIHTNEKPYACMYCGRNFRQRTILNQHIRIHTGEKPYKCGQCGKDFRQKAILDQHTRTHQGERPFCCPMPNCRRRFSTESEVKRHIDNHMNPHSKRNLTKPSTKSTDRSTDNPISLVKPELYFPQCYTPSFNQNYQLHQSLINSPEFKSGLSTPAPQIQPTAVQ